MARKKSKQKYTLNEFKAWLAGIEELNDDSWHPSKNQWDLIRDKIFNIKDVDTINSGVQHKTTQIGNDNNVPFANPVVDSYQQNIHQQNIAASNLSSIDPVNIPEYEITPEAKKLLYGTKSGTTKTPDIDTSGGAYSTSFE